MDFGLRNKTAVVTGASRGIGRACALALAAEGASIACVATAAERCEEVSALCVEAGAPKAIAYGVDVASFDACQDFGRRVLEDFGGIDILVNNAGITRDGLFMRMKEEAWDAVLDTNLKGAFNMVRAFTRPLLKSPGSRIINLSSVVGIAGNPGQANYAASKGGLIALTRSLAKEFGGRGVLVNAIAPGFIATDMTSELSEDTARGMSEQIALGRIGSPEEIAKVALFLASDLSTYVTGQVLVADGGMRI